MSRQEFYKEFTRDNGLIVQALWDRSHMTDIDGKPNPYQPTQVSYLHDGVVEIWNNRQAVNWYKTHLLRKIQSDRSFFTRRMDDYRRDLRQSVLVQRQGSLDSMMGLKSYIELIQKLTDNFLIFYYPSYDSRTPADIKERAQEIRDADTLYDDVNRVIANTLGRLFPSVRDYANALMAEELDHVPGSPVLRKRYQHFIYITGLVAASITLETFAQQHSEYKFVFDRIDNHLAVTGQVAYPGYTRGRVRILKRKSQVDQFERNEVLVSPMTTPDFLPAMKKAAAFVTDEGGIVCHAAIIARELKIPCVTGTRVATQIFFDGDLVEVDAQTGVVRKVSN